MNAPSFFPEESLCDFPDCECCYSPEVHCQACEYRATRLRLNEQEIDAILERLAATSNGKSCTAIITPPYYSATAANTACVWRRNHEQSREPC